MVCRDSWVNDVVMDTEEKITQDSSGLTPTYYMPMTNLSQFEVQFYSGARGGGKVKIFREFSKEELGLICDLIRSFKTK